MELKNGKDAMRALINEAHRTHLNADDVLWSAGYRLDPYPNGKSKPELIDIIAQKDASLSRARNLLRSEHERRVKETYAIDMDRHQELKPDCEVCRFLAETSLVKA